MIELDRRLATEGLETRLLLQVHAELVLEAPIDEVERASELVRTVMEGVRQLDVPLVADLGVGDNEAK